MQLLRLQVLFFLLFCMIRLGGTKYCTKSYPCTRSCSRRTYTTTKCGMFGWDRCRRSKTVYYSCRRTCYRNVCCTGYTGYRCLYPICFGSTSCPNGGSCASPNWCSCRSGYQSPSCYDINECARGTSGCQHKCSNTYGSYRCSCITGYLLLPDRRSCLDIDECARRNGGCNQTCENQQGSFRCGCHPGYELASDRKTCKDIDECQRGTSGCQQGCVNTHGSFKCTCTRGYVLSLNRKTCEDVDECTRNPSPCLHSCQNTPGSYRCICNNGYVISSDGKSCTVIDRCKLNNGGCKQICTSQFGVRICSCGQGFVLNSDNSSCSDINECSKRPQFCEQNCMNTRGSFRCTCNRGFILSANKRSCKNVDDCKGIKCENGGTCIDEVNGYTCSCNAGFSGNHCKSDVNECSALNGGCEDMCHNTFGSFKCTCKEGRALNSDGRSCSGQLVTKSVFTRHNILDNLLPSGCHVIELFKCPAGERVEVQLSSTSPWYHKLKDEKSSVTRGVVFMEVNNLKIPFSLTGAEVYKGLRLFSLSYVVKNNTGVTSNSVGQSKSKDCFALPFTQKDLHDFMNAGSFPRSVFKAFRQRLPNWIKFRHSNGSAVKIQDLMTDLVFGSKINKIAECKGAPVFSDSLYSVFRFGSEFSLSLYGDELHVPKLLKNTRFCLLVDICNDQGGTAFMMFPEESRDILLKLEVFKSLHKSSNLLIRPLGFGISLAKQVNLSHNQSELFLWNGDSIFQYRLPEAANLWIGSDIIYKTSEFEAQGRVNLFASVPSIPNILRSVFYDEWNVLLRFGATAGIKFHFELFRRSYTVTIPLGGAKVDAFMSLGGQKPRLFCGHMSNPPGIFLATHVFLNPFHSVPVLRDLVFDFSVKLHAFATIHPKVKLPKNDISVDEVLGISNLTKNAEKLLEKLKKLIGSYSLITSPVGTLQNIISRKMSSIQMSLTKVFLAINHNQFKNIPEVFSNLWSQISNLEEENHKMSYEIKQLKNNTIIAIQTFITKEIMNLKKRVSKAIYEMTNQITSALQHMKGWGVKLRASLTIFGLKLFGIDFEVVYSDEALMQCSRFEKIKDLLKGKKALRVLGRFSQEKRLGYFITADRGLGLGFAISSESNDIVLQINAYIAVLGIKVTGDLFVTRKGLSIYLEGNVWDLFYAQLDIYAGVHKNWYELEFSVRGRFVANARKKRQTQTVTTSFQGSYLDALRKGVRSISDYAEKRLSQAQNAIGNIKQKLTKAQRWFENKKEDVRNANGAFDRAVRSLGRVKSKLEAAKGPYYRALGKLNAAQRKVDKLCRIKRCNRICVPGLKCKTCRISGWGFSVSYPCCRLTSCMISFPNPVCVLENAACSVIRGIAYLALEAAKIFIRIPMLVFDAAKLAVSAAQVIVDKSRVVLQVAEVALDVAKLSLEAVKIALDGAKVALEVVRRIIGAAAKVLDFVIRYGLQSLIDVRNCGFQVKLSTVDIAIFDVSCEVNAFKLGWQTIRIRINFKNILESIWSAARTTINHFMKVIGGIFTGKRKREMAHDMSANIHLVLRKLREAGGPGNTKLSNLNETIDVTEDLSGFEQNFITDYEERTSLFAHKCKTFTRHFAFLNDTVNALNAVAAESLISYHLANKVSSQIDEKSSVNTNVNFTAENLGINVKYGRHYGLSEENIRKALKDAEPALKRNPDFDRVRNISMFSKQVITNEIDSMDVGQIASTWILALENVTLNHFNRSECADFSDCVLHSVSSMYEIFAVNEHSNISEIKTILGILEDEILRFTQNETYDIIGIHNATTAIKKNLENLNDLNIFCRKAPEFISNLQNVTTELHGNATFFCNVRSDVDVNFWWYQGDRIIANEHSSILIMTNVTENDEPYRCLAGNIVANITSNDAYLTFVNSSKAETDLCSIDNGGCEHECTDVNGTKQCSCYKGFVIKADFRSCTDVDECKSGKNDCEQICTNTMGSYTCSCKDEFIYNMTLRKCEKVKDACELDGLNCTQTAGCKEDGEGGPSCFCMEGHQLDQTGTQCEDVNECERNISDCSQGCRNKDGGFECFCHTGFYPDEDNTCTECEYPTWGDNCSQTCDCMAATKCDHVKGCICETGWRGTKCDQDIDECAENPGLCKDKLKECINEDGYFTCICKEGYEENQNGTCRDVKECSGSPKPCEQLCIEQDGGYQCACNPGLSLAKDRKSCIYACVATCKGEADGNYQSCATLTGYVSCVGGLPYVTPCPYGLIWNDSLKRCIRPDKNHWPKRRP